MNKNALIGGPVPLDRTPVEHAWIKSLSLLPIKPGGPGYTCVPSRTRGLQHRASGERTGTGRDPVLIKHKGHAQTNVNAFGANGLQDEGTFTPIRRSRERSREGTRPAARLPASSSDVCFFQPYACTMQQESNRIQRARRLVAEKERRVALESPSRQHGRTLRQVCEAFESYGRRPLLRCLFSCLSARTVFPTGDHRKKRT